MFLPCGSGRRFDPGGARGGLSGPRRVLAHRGGEALRRAGEGHRRDEGVQGLRQDPRGEDEPAPGRRQAEEGRGSRGGGEEVDAVGFLCFLSLEIAPPEFLSLLSDFSSVFLEDFSPRGHHMQEVFSGSIAFLVVGPAHRGAMIGPTYSNMGFNAWPIRG